MSFDEICINPGEIGASTVYFDEQLTNTLLINNQEVNIYTLLSDNNANKLNFNNGNTNNNNFDNNYCVLACAATSSGFTLLQLYDAYYSCRKHKRYKFYQLEFEIDLHNQLFQLWNEINSKTYEISLCKCFIIRDPKLREIFANEFRDRIVHHLIVNELESLFEEHYIENNFSCRKGKGTLKAQLKAFENIYTESKGYTEDCYIGKFDCKSFFCLIDKNLLWKQVQNFVNENYHKPTKELLLWLIYKVIMYNPQDNCIRISNEEEWEELPDDKTLFEVSKDFGLPKGSITSYLFTNFYLIEFDKWASKLFPSYIRYADDILIIGKSSKECRKFYRNARDYLYETRKVVLNPDKIYIQHYKKGVKFLGVILKPNRIYISNRVKGKIYNLTKTFTYDKIPSLNSYLGLLSHFSTYNILIVIQNNLKSFNLKFKNYAVHRT